MVAVNSNYLGSVLPKLAETDHVLYVITPVEGRARRGLLAIVRLGSICQTLTYMWLCYLLEPLGSTGTEEENAESYGQRGPSMEVLIQPGALSESVNESQPTSSYMTNCSGKGHPRIRQPRQGEGSGDSFTNHFTRTLWPERCIDFESWDTCKYTTDVWVILHRGRSGR
jgi:hypothetical protein